ncbi:hypothetical protein L8C07_05510 [Paenibacillus sp. CMAA1739]|nr:hypothetical protein [Paenibacillus sp. CMAA1739]
MGIYYNVAIPDKKENYWLGTISPARKCLFYLLEKQIGQTIVFYGDETHGWCDDVYGVNIEENAFNEEGFYQLNADSYPVSNSEWVDEHTLTPDEFHNLLNKIGGRPHKYLGDGKFE